MYNYYFHFLGTPFNSLNIIFHIAFEKTMKSQMCVTNL